MKDFINEIIDNLNNSYENNDDVTETIGDTEDNDDNDDNEEPQ